MLGDDPDVSNSTDFVNNITTQATITTTKQKTVTTINPIPPIYRVTSRILTNTPNTPIAPLPVFIGDKPTLRFGSCWAMDNVLIVNSADAPQSLYEDFDPVDPGNWLFFPGANIRVGGMLENIMCLYFSVL